MAQTVKNPPVMQETWVRSLGWEDPLEGGAWQPTPVFLPGESPWTEEPGRLQSMGLQRVRHNRATKHSISGVWLYNSLASEQYPEVWISNKTVLGAFFSDLITEFSVVFYVLKDEEVEVVF